MKYTFVYPIRKVNIKTNQIVDTKLYTGEVEFMRCECINDIQIIKLLKDGKVVHIPPVPVDEKKEDKQARMRKTNNILNLKNTIVKQILAGIVELREIKE